MGNVDLGARTEQQVSALDETACPRGQLPVGAERIERGDRTWRGGEPGLADDEGMPKLKDMHSRLDKISVLFP